VAVLFLLVVPVLVVVCCTPGHLQGGCGCRREAVLRQEREETGAALEGRGRTGAGRDLVAREGAGGRGSAGCSKVEGLGRLGAGQGWCTGGMETHGRLQGLRRCRGRAGGWATTCSAAGDARARSDGRRRKRMHEG
jgi:hypothetical protein